MKEAGGNPTTGIAKTPAAPVSEPALPVQVQPQPRKWRGWLLKSTLTLAGLGLLAVPDWIDWRQSRFAWEDFRGTYVLGGALTMLVILVLGRLLAMMFDAGTDDHGEAQWVAERGRVRNQSRSPRP